MYQELISKFLEDKYGDDYLSHIIVPQAEILHDFSMWLDENRPTLNEPDRLAGVTRSEDQ